MIAEFQEAVLGWYAHNGRILPWRQTVDPYAIMVSEIMLQQTQVDRVIPKYLAWLELFPTVDALATAPSAEVIQAWAGLGYNRRALFLQRTAQAVSTLGAFPTNYDELKKLPGLGPYTAAAILSFAFNQDVALVDTNIKRIYQLLFFGDHLEPTDKAVREVATECLPAGHSRDWHNALMDIGTVISKNRGAAAQQQALTSLFPILHNFELPKVSELPLKRPKQSDFKSSRRFWRGRIVNLLNEHKKLSQAKLSTLLGQPCPYPIEEILTGLVKDGLISRRTDDTFQLGQPE